MRQQLDPFNFSMCLDSGAYSIYHQNMRKQGATGITMKKRLGSFDFARSAEFRSYMDSYIEFLIDNRTRYDFYVTLDVLHNHKMSWQTFMQLRREGLSPVPVFHVGGDLSYLSRYLDETDYIGLSGFSSSASVVSSYLDRIFKDYLTDKAGRPTAKVHGFAMTSARSMMRYPFFSADSTSWGFASRFGGILMPQPVMSCGVVEGFSFLGNRVTLRVTKRTTHLNSHFSKMGDKGKHCVDEYLSIFGGALEDSEGLEDITFRDLMNVYYMMRMEEDLKRHYEERWGYKEGGNIYMSGSTTESLTSAQMRNRLLRPISELLPKQRMRYMGSYFALKQSDNFSVASNNGSISPL